MLIFVTIYTIQTRMIQNDLTPFGFIVDGSEPEAEVMDGDYWMFGDDERKDFYK